MWYIPIQTAARKNRMTTTPRFTSADLESFPDNDGKRYFSSIPLK